MNPFKTLMRGLRHQEEPDVSDETVKVPKDLRPTHCDQRVVHRPGVCQYCDKFGAHFQKIREWWGINFTGEKDPDKMPCPADLARGDGHTAWGRNTAKKPVCRGCKHGPSYHEAGKCLFGPGQYDPMSLDEESQLRNEELARWTNDLLAGKGP